MIKYAVKCAESHSFDVWFRSAEDCEQQLSAGLVSCPTCGGPAREKALMAPRLGRPEPEPTDPEQAKPAQEGAAGAATPAPLPTPPLGAAPGPASEMMLRAAHARQVVEAKLRALRAHVEATADYVGGGFADEARRIHDGEAEERAIYGEATAEDVEALVEDGVPCAPIPWIDRRDD